MGRVTLGQSRFVDFEGWQMKFFTAVFGDGWRFDGVRSYCGTLSSIFVSKEAL